VPWQVGNHEEEGLSRGIPSAEGGCPLPCLELLELSVLLGIFGVPQHKLIDVDEFGISLEKCNRTGGWALRVFRVRKDGHFHHGAKITVLFAIKPGDPALPLHVRGSVQHPRH
jgi:hypothetical protein